MSLSRLAATVDRIGDLSRSLEASKARQAEAERLQSVAEERLLTLSREVAAQEVRESAQETLMLLKEELNDLVWRIEDNKDRVHDLRNSLRKISQGQCPVIGIDCEQLKKRGSGRRAVINTELSKLREDLALLREKETKIHQRVESFLRVKKPDASSARSDTREAERDLKGAKAALREAQASYARVEVNLQSARKAKADARKARAQISVVERGMRQEKFMQFMCGKSGIPAALIETELQHVEDRCNWILERLEYSKRIKFSAFKELAGYEKVCPRCGGETWRSGVCSSCGTDRPRKRKDEPTVTVLDGEAERAFDLESGGARVLQSFAVRMAASLFVSSMTGVPLQMIMLDEVFAHLDANNRRRLMALVLDKLQAEFGLRQIFTVSHHDDVINAVDDILLVWKVRGQSTVVWMR